MKKGPRAGRAERRREVRKWQGQGGGGGRPSVQRPQRRALVGSRLEGCGQTRARPGPPPVIAPFSPASTRQPGGQGARRQADGGAGAPERDGSDGPWRGSRLWSLCPQASCSGVPAPSPPRAPAEEESRSWVNWGSNPLLPGSAWPQPFPVWKPLVPSPQQQVQSWAHWPPFPGLALSEQQGLHPFCPFCLLDLPLFLAPTILHNPLHVPPTSLSCPGWSP